MAIAGDQSGLTRIDLVLAALVLVITLVLFAPTLGFEFVGVDDGVYVTDNAMVQRGLSAEGVAWAFSEFHGSTWVPMTYVSLMADSSVFGTGPRGFHFTNNLLHALNGVLLYLLFVRLTGQRFASVLVALLFVAHPMRAESVAWVTERKDVLSGVFCWATLLLWVEWVRGHKKWQYIAALICFALGLAAKATLMTLPVILLLLDVWPLGRTARLWPRVAEKLPFFAVAVAAAVVAFVAQASGTSVTDLATLGLVDRVANAFVGYATYVARLLWPMNLSYYYPHPSFLPPYDGWSASRVAMSIVVLVAISAVCVALVRRGLRSALAGWSWFLLTLLPVIGIVQIGMHATADRFSYIPHVGLIAGSVFAISTFVARRESFRKPVIVGAVLLLCANGALTARELPHWRDSEALFSRAIEVTQNNGVAMNALGAHLARVGRVDEALRTLERAVAVQPAHASAHANLGIVLALQGSEDDRAIEHLLMGLEGNPEHARAHVALANVYARRGSLSEAVQHYRRAIESDPREWAAHFGLGQIARARGNQSAAEEHYRRALELAPDEDGRSRVRAVYSLSPN